MTTDTTPRHDTGILTAYLDILGRKQYSVTGSKAHVLITSGSGAAWSVWRSDSIDTIASGVSITRAIQIARNAAGVDHDTAFPDPMTLSAS